VEVPLDICEGNIEQFTTGDHHQIQSGRRSVQMPEHLAYQSFSSVSADRVTQFPGCDDPQSRGGTLARREEQREIPRRHAVAGVEHPLELTSPPHAPRLPERVRRHAALPLGRGNGEPLSPLGATALQHQPPVFRGHSGQKAVRLLAPAAVGLKSTFHCKRTPNTIENARRNLDINGSVALVSMR